MSLTTLSAPAAREYGCSFAVITVVKEAHEHFLRLVGSHQTDTRNGYPWTVAELPGADGSTHTVVEGQVPERSLLPAENFAAQMLDTWAPRCLLIADCGGGIQHGVTTAHKDIKLGDVVVGEFLHHYELKKLKSGKGDSGLTGWLRSLFDGNRRTAIYISWLHTSPTLRAQAKRLNEISPAWSEQLIPSRPEANGSPTLLLGDLVSGDKLLDDAKSAEVKEIVDTYERALAVDMETVGVAHAAFSAVDRGLGLSFLAFRGISDWIDGDGNQKTRNEWKGPACEAAVAAAVRLIGVTPVPTSAMNSDELRSRDILRKRLSTRYAPPREAYQLRINAHKRTVTRNDAVILAIEGQGAVLIGDAGSGKSVVLQHAALALMSPLDPFPVLIDLKRWEPSFGHGLAKDPTGNDLLPSLDALLRASVQRIGVDLLDEIAKRRQVMLLVDGMNEVSYGEIGRRILALLDEYMRLRPKVRVLVTDRTAREFYKDSDWQILRIQPLDAAEVERVIEQEQPDSTKLRPTDTSLLRIPFFLDRALRGGGLVIASRAAAVEDFFVKHLGIEGEKLERLAKAAFQVYAEDRRRTFSAEKIASACGEETLTTLRDGGLLIGEEEIAFDHQIEHDFLAARHLAADRSRWAPDILDALTFEAASFDVLGLAIEHLTEAADRDVFLRDLYDWSWRGTIEAMASAEQDHSPAASPSLRTALLAVVAEKRFDRVDGTRQRSEQQLSRFPGPQPKAMATAPSLAELIKLVLEGDGPEWFSNWQRVFARVPATGPLTESELAPIDSADPVIGWTTANVARRFPAEESRSAQLREIYADWSEANPAHRAVRWRVVHALGAWPSEDNATTLLEAVGDEHMWVSYGAVRSLTEMAATAGDVALRDRIVGQLRGRLGTILPEPLSQIAYTSRYAGADEGFREEIKPLLGEILEMQANESEKRLWEARIERFESFWGEGGNA